VKRIRAELAFSDDALLGEGPVWEPSSRSLWWTDVPRRRLLRGDPGSGAVTVTLLPGAIASFAFRSDGSLISARHGAFVVVGVDAGVHPDLTEVAPIPDEQRWPDNHFNDGKCDARGRFWVGSVSSPVEACRGGLYRLDGDHRVSRVLDGVAISNGMGWSPEDRTFFYIDSLLQAVDAFTYDADSGMVRDRRRMINVPMRAGLPAVHRYSPEGRLDLIVDVPVACATSVAFGGPQLRDLYITTGKLQEGPMTTRFGVTVPPAQPLAGSVFVCSPGTPGVAVHQFAG
jgi:sugar lactone lactonase YvrE